MTIRLREMEAVTELRELRLRLMELETQVIENRRKTAVLLLSQAGKPWDLFEAIITGFLSTFTESSAEQST